MIFRSTSKSSQEEKDGGKCETIGHTIMGLIVAFLAGFIIYTIATWNKVIVNRYA